MKNILLPFVLSCFVFGCSQTPIQQNTMITTNTTNLNVGTQKGANLSVNLNIDSFKVKDFSNTDGTVAKEAADIKSIKLYLTKSDTNPLLESNIVLKTETALAYKTSYTFSNVPEGGPYYVAVELFSDTAGTENIIEPIAYTSVNLGDTGTKGLTVSSNSATVANDLSVTFTGTNTTSFDIAPKLLDAVGAKLEASVTVVPGVDTNVGNISSSVEESVID